MTRIRNWVLVVCSAFLLTNYSTTNAQNNTSGVALDPAQVYTSPNLVNPGVTANNANSGWQNVGLVDQGLPCWQPGGPIYCGPKPYLNNGSFNFSYGHTDVYQILNIANALPNSGSGLRVNGFNFGFTAKNGNGWDNGQKDYLVAYVNFYGADGSQAQSYNYGNVTNNKYNWTTFNFSETFPTPYATKDLSTARYGFVGYDTNGWAGPYGPEITNINFSLKFSVDPCAVDVMSSPSCPGYLDKINSLTGASPTSSTVTTTTSSTTTAAPTTTVAAPTAFAPATTDVAQPVATTTSTTSTVAAPIASTSTATTSVTPTATNPQPKVGEVTVSGSPAKTTMSTSQLLAIVRNEQSRISNLETSTAQQAVEQAQAASDKAQKDSISISMSTLSQSQNSAQSIATMFATNPSQASNNMNNGSQVNNNTGNNSIANFTPAPNRATIADLLKQPEVSSAVTQTVVVAKPTMAKPYEPPIITVEPQQPSISKPQSIYSLTSATSMPQPTTTTVAMVSPQVSYSLTKPETKQQEEEQPKAEGIKFTGNNPIMNIINNPPTQQQTTDTQTTTTAVNTRVQDNEIAGGVSLETMAKQPAGFQNYMGVIPDVAFYAPKEIYRNQKVVDNARAQRLLNVASDRLHQQMIDQQYKLGN